MSFHLPLWECPLKFQSPQNNCVCFSQQEFLREGFPGEAMVKNPPIKAGDPGSVPGRADPLEEEVATPSSTPVWRSAWTEEPGGLQSGVAQSRTRVGTRTHSWAEDGVAGKLAKRLRQGGAHRIASPEPGLGQSGRSGASGSLPAHGLQHARPPCPPPTPGAC